MIRKLSILTWALFLLLACNKNPNELIVKLSVENLTKNPLPKQDILYLHSNFSAKIPNWPEIKKLNLHAPQIAELRYLEYAGNPLILWDTIDVQTCHFYYIPDSVNRILPIQMTSTKWKNRIAYTGDIDVMVHYTDSTTNPVSLTFPLKIRVIPDENRLDYWPIDYRLGAIQSNLQATKFILIHNTPFSLLYKREQTSLLSDENHDGFFCRYPEIDSSGIFYNSEASELHKPFMLNGQAYVVKEIALDGSYVSIAQTEVKVALNRGFKLPEFQAVSLEGDTLTSKLFENKLTIIYWWGVGCSGCERARPGLNQLFAKYKTQNDIAFLALSRIPKASALEYLAKKTLDLPVFLGDEPCEMLFGKAAPHFIVLDKTGTVIYNTFGGGPDSYKLIDAVFQKVLNGEDNNL
ncbi:TlpA family protein disulfide reductase [candidate division KSB1 bacterium]|nr:TlpA family protein disulfide reductase [candidate division KSB1 bacterium]